MVSLARVRAAVGCGVLRVEHDMGVVMPLCDHVVVMNFGRVLASGSPSDVRAIANVQAAYPGAAA